MIQYMDGMLLEHRYDPGVCLRIDGHSDYGGYFLREDGVTFFQPRMVLDDPATIGCLLAQARRAVGVSDAHPLRCGEGWVFALAGGHLFSDTEDGDPLFDLTEGELLLRVVRAAQP